MKNKDILKMFLCIILASIAIFVITFVVVFISAFMAECVTRLMHYVFSNR